MYDVASIGYRGPVVCDRSIAEPYNLGRAWVGFDLGEAFGCPVKVVNDARHWEATGAARCSFSASEPGSDRP
jgi:predicted NBD/HSP70 family sugar kinase